MNNEELLEYLLDCINIAERTEYKDFNRAKTASEMIKNIFQNYGII